MEIITTFLGRFHPLLVHLPIGILLLAFLFECLSLQRRHKRLRKAVQPALLLGAVSAVAAAITGFFLRQEGGYNEIIANRHQNFGILTAVLALVVYILRPKVKYWIDTSKRIRQVKLALSGPLIGCLIITGHLGGSLTHGEDYLSAAMPLADGNAKDPAEAIRMLANVEEALLYDHVVRPILDARCYDCHSSSRQKGNLRLDGAAFIARGGDGGPVINSGLADSSTLFRRLSLPLEDEDHMPPREKPQLSSSEIALVKYWIESGASFEKTVNESKSAEKIAAIIRSMQQPPAKSWVPTEAVAAADVSTLNSLREHGIHPIPLSQSDNYLMVSFAGTRQIPDTYIYSLKQIQEQLVWLNLGNSGISDKQLEAVGQLRNLRVLYLNNTGITDAGLARISSLTDLRWLNIAGTKVSDSAVPTLSQLRHLTDLYVFRTNLTQEGMRSLARDHKEMKIEAGEYSLEKLPTDTVVYKRQL